MKKTTTMEYWPSDPPQPSQDVLLQVLESMKSVNRGTRKQREKRRFLFYLLYAWGLPLVVTGFTALMDMVDGLVSPKFKPNMGKFGCWFSVIGGRLYFYIPVAILTTCNIAMFVLTAWNCSKVKADLARMQNSSGDRAKRRYLADKNKMMMNVKLFVVMGVTWAIEVISSVVELPQEIWYLADAANALQGVLIFCIFVLKRKVLHKLGRQLGVKLCLKTTATPGGSTTTNDRLNTVCYDPYRIRKSSSNSTLYTASTTFTGTSTRSTPG
uniref:(California timema) hypothetical protein n=1 Tax=Timema californicum TaxID=61474 RepID=A0A7R9JFF4_TIMCA|nr:unnamed protein product [Timema californicum]